MDDRQDAARGDRAKQIMDDPIFQECFVVLGKKTMDGIKATKFDDIQARERLYMMAKALEDVETHFKAIMQRGEMAKINIKGEKKAA